jgi:enoyl-CoA hydratase/carnithine racemase
MTRVQWTRQHEIFERVAVALTDLPLPVIAAVNGHAYGGGLELALACDFIHARASARFALQRARAGTLLQAGRHPCRQFFSSLSPGFTSCYSYHLFYFPASLSV